MATDNTRKLNDLIEQNKAAVSDLSSQLEGDSGLTKNLSKLTEEFAKLNKVVQETTVSAKTQSNVKSEEHSGKVTSNNFSDKQKEFGQYQRTTPTNSTEYSLSEEEIENFGVQRSILEALEDIRNCCGGGFLKGKGNKEDKGEGNGVAGILSSVDDFFDVAKHLKSLKPALAQALPAIATLGTAAAGAAAAVAGFSIGKWLSEEFDKTETGKHLTKMMFEQGKEQVQASRAARKSSLEKLESIKDSNPELYEQMKREIGDAAKASRDKRKEDDNSWFSLSRWGFESKTAPSDNGAEDNQKAIDTVVEKHKAELEKRKLGGPVEPKKQYVAGEEGQEVFIADDGKYSQMIGNYGPELLESQKSGFVYPITGQSKDETLNRKFLDTDKAGQNAFVSKKESDSRPQEADPIKQFPGNNNGMVGNFMGAGSALGVTNYGMVGISPSTSNVARAMPGIGKSNVPGAAGETIDSIVSGSGDQAFLNQIYNMEGTSDAQAQKHGYATGYDAVLGYGKYGGKPGEGKPLSQMTMAEVRQLQENILKHPDNNLNSSAVGKPQIVGKTLFGRENGQYGTGGVYQELGLKEDDIFDQKLQDRIALHLANKRGLQQYKNGKISEEEFQQRLSPEWQSIQRQGLTPELRNAMRAAKQPIDGQGTLGSPSIAYDRLKSGQGLPTLPANVSLAGSAAQPGALDGVDPALIEGILGASKNWKGRVEITSGKRQRSATEKGNHSAGLALDTQLYDEQGRKISNFGNKPGEVNNPQAYETFMKDAVAWGSQYDPTLTSDARWGGYFGDTRDDYMHIDRNGRKGSSRGSWKTGRSAGDTVGLQGKTWDQYRQERFGTKPEDQAQPVKPPLTPQEESQLADMKQVSTAGNTTEVTDSNTLTTRTMNTPATSQTAIPDARLAAQEKAKNQKPDEVKPYDIDREFARAQRQEELNNQKYAAQKAEKLSETSWDKLSPEQQKQEEARAQATIDQINQNLPTEVKPTEPVAKPQPKQESKPYDIDREFARAQRQEELNNQKYAAQKAEKATEASWNKLTPEQQKQEESKAQSIADQIKQDHSSESKSKPYDIDREFARAQRQEELNNQKYAAQKAEKNEESWGPDKEWSAEAKPVDYKPKGVVPDGTLNLQNKMELAADKPKSAADKLEDEFDAAVSEERKNIAESDIKKNNEKRAKGQLYNPAKESPPKPPSETPAPTPAKSTSISGKLNAEENKAMRAAMQQAAEGPAGKPVAWSAGGGKSTKSSGSISGKLNAEENKAMSAAMQQAAEGPAGKPVAWSAENGKPSTSGNQIHQQTGAVADTKRAAKRTASHAPSVARHSTGSGGRPEMSVNVGKGPSRNQESMWQQYVLSRYGLGSAAR